MEEIIYRKSNKNDLPQILDLLRSLDLDASNMSADGFLVASLGELIEGFEEIPDNSLPAIYLDRVKVAVRVNEAKGVSDIDGISMVKEK